MANQSNWDRIRKFRITRQDWRYASVLLASCLSSAVGIVWAAFHNWQDGGRGGAVAVTIAFAALFIRRDFGQIAYQTIAVGVPQLKNEILEILSSILPTTNPSAPPAATQNLQNQLNGLIEEMKTNSSGQARQNAWIATASVVGTLAWGFGDWVSLFLQVHFCLHHS